MSFMVRVDKNFKQPMCRQKFKPLKYIWPFMCTNKLQSCKWCENQVLHPVIWNSIHGKYILSDSNLVDSFQLTVDSICSFWKLSSIWWWSHDGPSELIKFRKLFWKLSKRIFVTQVKTHIDYISCFFHEFFYN